MAAIAGPRNAPVVPWSTRAAKTNGKFGQIPITSAVTATMLAASAARARFERTVKQFATRRQSKQAGETARGEDEADGFLRPFLLGQINGDIGTETSQHGRIEKIDPVKAVQARTRWRGLSSIGQRYNECHLLNVLSYQKPGGAAALYWGESLIVCRVRSTHPAQVML